MVPPFAGRVRRPLVVGHEHPDEGSVLAHALEVLAREGTFPFAARYSVGSGDIDELVPSFLVSIAHRHFMVATGRGVDEDGLRERQELECQFRSGWRSGAGHSE